MSSFLIDVKVISRVKLGNYNIDAVLKELQQELDKDIALPHSLKSLIKVLLIIAPLLCQRLGLNSRNSGKPPSSDPNRDKKKAKSSQGKPGGQKGHILVTLQNADFRANTAVSVQGAFVKECRLPFKQMQHRNETAVTLPKGGA